MWQGFAQFTTFSYRWNYSHRRPKGPTPPRQGLSRKQAGFAAAECSPAISAWLSSHRLVRYHYLCRRPEVLCGRAAAGTRTYPRRVKSSRRAKKRAVSSTENQDSGIKSGSQNRPPDLQRVGGRRKLIRRPDNCLLLFVVQFFAQLIDLGLHGLDRFVRFLLQFAAALQFRLQLADHLFKAEQLRAQHIDLVPGAAP